MKCGSCGAQIGAQEINCRFCGAVTQFGLHQQHHERQHRAHLEALEKHHALHGEAQRQAEAQASLKRTANFSLFWGIGGFLLCVCFIPSVVAVVLGLRARTMSKKYGLVLPANATVGLALGAVGLLSGASLIVIGIVSDMKKQARIDELDAQLQKASEQTLDQPTACRLTEKRLLQKGFGGDKSVDEFECDGKLVQNGTRATLESVRFEADTKDVTVRACLEYGARWSVQGFRVNAACDQPDDTNASAPVSSAAGAEPTASSRPAQPPPSSSAASP